MSRHIDAIVADWNATLETGDPDAIESARRAALQEVAHLVMEDDPTYARAGYDPGTT